MLQESRNIKRLIETPSLAHKSNMLSSTLGNDEQSIIKRLRKELLEKNEEVSRLKAKLESGYNHSELRRALKQMQDFLTLSPVAIYFKNQNLEYSYANHSFAVWVNLPVDDLIGKDNLQLQVGGYLTELEQLEALVIKSGEAVQNKEIKFAQEEEQYLMRTYVYPMKDSLGGTEGVMVCCFDLNEKLQYNKELKEAQEKAFSGEKSKSAFLANLSHEIRTPLHGILGSGALLKSLLKGKEAQGLVENINNSGTSLLEMVNSMLLFESLEKGKWTLNKQEFNLTSLMQDVSKGFEDQARLKMLDIQNFVAHGLPEVLIGDIEKIKIILKIFLSNALKFTDKGFVHLFVQEDQRRGKGIRLKFSIKDTGMGIKKALQANLFSSFTQGDSSSTKGYQGTGIGLAMAKKTALYLGGSIGLESDEFKGSIFWFTVDLETIQNKLEEPVLLPAQLPVLLVEDNKINQKIAFFTLKKLGFPVDIAENGQEAIERYKEGMFKIILMDIQMPVMNGFDATTKIRSYEKSKDLDASLIIALSANTIKEDVEKCFLVGMNEYISKPFSPQKLIEEIQKHINIKL